jgi:phosphoglycolate phosphatase
VTSTTDRGRPAIELVCLDMAGTTVRDEGTVMRAFTAAITACGLQPGTPPWDDAMRTVQDTMGQSKIEVFREILGDEALAATANSVFEQAYEEQVAAGEVEPMPGAADLFAALRDAGVTVCLTTGFSPRTRQALLDRLGWTGLVDLSLSPADAGRGRPWPDLVLRAALDAQVASMAAVAVVGDTPSDVLTGLHAGAGLVVGVTSGSGSSDELRAAGAHQVVAGLREVADLVAGDRQLSAAGS